MKSHAGIGLLLALGIVAPLLFVTNASAAQPAGEIVALDGDGTIVRAGTAQVATVGLEVEMGDTVRTGKPGRIRLLFVDGSTIVIGDASELLIDEHVFDPAGGKARTLLRLLEGKVRAIVSEYYGDASASYEIRTPGAVAGVRGTEFVVDYDPRRASTDIAAFSGEVVVSGVTTAADTAVVLAADQITAVKNGGTPVRPRALSASERGRYLEGFQLSGIGEIGATLEQDAVMQGEEVPQSERPALGGPAGGAVGTAERLGEDPGGAPTTPSDAVGQPIPALEGPGQVGVPF